jgi:small conductance mechanosensitive channel
MEEQLQTSFGKLIEKLSSWVDLLILSLPNFLMALITFSIAYWVSKHLQGYLNRLLKKVIKQASIRGLITNIVSIIIIILGVLLALAILNLDGTLKSLLAGAGVAGLAISLALQGTLSNTFSGIFIAIKNELNVGDYIDSNGYSGEVVEIDLRNTKIREADNNIVVIPNKMILDNPFKNFGLTRQIRTMISCGVDYDSDLDKVEQISKDTIEELFPSKNNRPVEFYYTEFGASSIDFVIRFWQDGKKNLTAIQVKSLAIKALKKAFDQNGISIPFPTRTLVTVQENE